LIERVQEQRNSTERLSNKIKKFFGAHSRGGWNQVQHSPRSGRSERTRTRQARWKNTCQTNNTGFPYKDTEKNKTTTYCHKSHCPVVQQGGKKYRRVVCMVFRHESTASADQKHTETTMCKGEVFIKYTAHDGKMHQKKRAKLRRVVKQALVMVRGNRQGRGGKNKNIKRQRRRKCMRQLLIDF